MYKSITIATRVIQSAYLLLIIGSVIVKKRKELVSKKEMKELISVAKEQAMSAIITDMKREIDHKDGAFNDLVRVSGDLERRNQELRSKLRKQDQEIADMRKAVEANAAEKG